MPRLYLRNLDRLAIACTDEPPRLACDCGTICQIVPHTQLQTGLERRQNDARTITEKQPSMLRLIIQSGSLVGRQFRLEPEKGASLSIGGSAESMVRLTEPSVSSRHALITFKDGAFHLIDQNSTN